MRKRSCLLQTVCDAYLVEPELYTYVEDLRSEKHILKQENKLLKERIEKQNAIIKKILNL